MTLATAKPVTFIQTRQPDSAAAFYRDALGLAYQGHDGFAHVFDLSGATLRITEIPGWTAGPHPALGWHVSDITGAMAALKAKGVAFLIYPGMSMEETGYWTAPDGKAKVAWFNDPDGNLLSLTEA